MKALLASLHEHPKKGTGRCTHRNRFPLLILLRHRMCRAHALPSSFPQANEDRQLLLAMDGEGGT
jgi:hypothetical protein